MCSLCVVCCKGADFISLLLFIWNQGVQLSNFCLFFSDDDFDMSRYSSSGYSSAEVRCLRGQVFMHWNSHLTICYPIKLFSKVHSYNKFLQSPILFYLIYL